MYKVFFSKDEEYGRGRHLFLCLK